MGSKSRKKKGPKTEIDFSLNESRLEGMKKKLYEIITIIECFNVKRSS
jgi:hypothetical protein